MIHRRRYRSILDVAVVVCGVMLIGCNATAAPAAKSDVKPAAVAATPHAPESPYDVPGFKTYVKDNRLWVFQDNSKDIVEFLKHGEPAKSITRPAAGPNGMTIRSGDSASIDAYLAQKTGFRAFIKDGRLWVFCDGSKDLAEFTKHGEPAKSITRPGAGPNRMTIRSGDAETIDAYLTQKPGFRTFIKDGRLWVFRDSSKDMAEFKKHGEPAKSVTRPGVGPNRMTIRSGDAATIDMYLQSL